MVRCANSSRRPAALHYLLAPLLVLRIAWPTTTHPRLRPSSQTWCSRQRCLRQRRARRRTSGLATRAILARPSCTRAAARGSRTSSARDLRSTTQCGRATLGDRGRSRSGGSRWTRATTSTASCTATFGWSSAASSSTRASQSPAARWASPPSPRNCLSTRASRASSLSSDR